MSIIIKLGKSISGSNWKLGVKSQGDDLTVCKIWNTVHETVILGLQIYLFIFAFTVFIKSSELYGSTNKNMHFSSNKKKRPNQSIHSIFPRSKSAWPKWGLKGRIQIKLTRPEVSSPKPVSPEWDLNRVTSKWRRDLWLCMGKWYNKAAVTATSHFVTFTKTVLGLWPTLSRDRIMLLVSNASIMVLIILVNFSLTVMVVRLKSEILPRDCYTSY